jgi:hypothetical protein
LPGKYAHKIKTLTNDLDADQNIATLYDEGYFYVGDAHQKRQSIQFPYILLSSLVSASSNPGLSSLLSPLKTISWQELETLEPEFLQLLVSSFNSIRKGLTVMFEDIWRGATASKEILQTKLRIPESFTTSHELHKWIDYDKKLQKYSAKDFPLVQCKGMDEMDLRNISGSFLACPGNALFDVRTVLEIDNGEIEEPLETIPVAGTRRYLTCVLFFF